MSGQKIPFANVTNAGRELQRSRAITDSAIRANGEVAEAPSL